MNKILLGIILVLAMIISYAFGYSQGAKDSVNWVVDAGMALIEKDKLNISIDVDMIKQGILQYKNNIGGCLFAEDAPIYDYTWNQA